MAKFTKADMIRFRNDTSIGSTFYAKYFSTLTIIQIIDKWFEIFDNEKKQQNKVNKRLFKEQQKKNHKIWFKNYHADIEDINNPNHPNNPNQ